MFPKHGDYARSLFTEATRHLLDARILHLADRYPGSITSSLKAVELSLKALLLLDGTTTLLDKLFQTHNVFTNVVSKYFKTTHLDILSTYDAWLPSDLIQLELLIPGRQDIQNMDIIQAANTEYPFFAQYSPAIPVLYMPGFYFIQTNSEKHFRTTHRLLFALQTLYPEITAWSIPLCPTI